MRKFFSAVVVIAVLALMTFVPAIAAGKSQTGQGIMVNLDATGVFAFTKTYTYAFNVATASGYYTNVWDGNAPVVSSVFNGPNVCTPSVPVAPAPPAADPSKVTAPSGVARRDRCVFLDGGVLSYALYTQSAVVPTSCTVGMKTRTRKDTFTWTYDISPTGSVSPFTAWDLVGTSGPGAAHVEIGASIAGESVLVSGKFPLPGKFSFSLVENDGVTSRVSDLALYLDSVLIANPGSAIEANCPGCLAGGLGAVDFVYSTNAGSNGTTSLLQNGDTRTILNGDAFAGNNNGGADGSALALANMDPVGVDVGAGDHTVGLTGVVKGNTADTSGGSDIAFSVTEVIHVVTPGCSAP